MYWCRKLNEQENSNALNPLKYLLVRNSLQSKEEFDKMNNIVGQCYTYPQTVEVWLKMETKYMRKTTFNVIHDSQLDIPKDLLLVIVEYL